MVNKQNKNRDSNFGASSGNEETKCVGLLLQYGVISAARLFPLWFLSKAPLWMINLQRDRNQQG